MKIYISYFYQVRNMQPYHIPISTALYDPKWFHEGKGQNHYFVDKRGVINGLHADALNPRGVVGDCVACQKHDDPNTCEFIRNYAAKLHTLDCREIVGRALKLCWNVQNMLGFKEAPVPVFLVHEAPENLCSERGPLMEWFRENGYEVEEFQPCG